MNTAIATERGWEMVEFSTDWETEEPTREVAHWGVQVERAEARSRANDLKSTAVMPVPSYDDMVRALMAVAARVARAEVR